MGSHLSIDAIRTLEKQRSSAGCNIQEKTFMRTHFLPLSTVIH